MEKGRYKGFTNRLRAMSNVIDLSEGPLALLGRFAKKIPVESIAALTTATAGVIDAIGRFQDGDKRGALQELIQGAVEAQVVKMPRLEYLQGFGIDLRKTATGLAGFACAHLFNFAARNEKYDFGIHPDFDFSFGMGGKSGKGWNPGFGFGKSGTGWSPGFA